jgi:FKBP12-rapamycin complex-associated protein
VEELWFEKLQRWDDALEAYEVRQLELPDDVELTTGRMRCLQALGEWSRLLTIGQKLWANTHLEESTRQEVAKLASTAGWNLGRWEVIPEYVRSMAATDPERHFFTALLALRQNNFKQAQKAIHHTRKLLDTTLTALVGESYTRAYKLVVTAQQLTEMEEVIAYKSTDQDDKKAMIRRIWSTRLKGAQRSVEVWLPILSVRSLVVAPQEDIPTWLKFSSLCRKHGRQALSLRILTNLLGFDPLEHHGRNWPRSLPVSLPRVTYAYVKHLWAAGELLVSAHSFLAPLLLLFSHPSYTHCSH